MTRPDQDMLNILDEIVDEYETYTETGYSREALISDLTVITLAYGARVQNSVLTERQDLVEVAASILSRIQQIDTELDAEEDE